MTHKRVVAMMGQVVLVRQVVVGRVLDGRTYVPRIHPNLDGGLRPAPRPGWVVGCRWIQRGIVDEHDEYDAGAIFSGTAATIRSWIPKGEATPVLLVSPWPSERVLRVPWHGGWEHTDLEPYSPADIAARRWWLANLDELPPRGPDGRWQKRR